jgi:hypothetical protein
MMTPFVFFASSVPLSAVLIVLRKECKEASLVSKAWEWVG